jgi:hypothetical protein
LYARLIVLTFSLVVTVKGKNINLIGKLISQHKT